MKIQMLKTAVTDKGLFKKGKSYDVSLSVGADFMNAKYAVEVVEEMRTATRKPTSTTTKKPTRNTNRRNKK